MTRLERSKVKKQFIVEYLVDFNATQAYLRCKPETPYASAGTLGSAMLRDPGVAEEIKRAVEERSKRTEIAADDVLRVWYATLLADPAEIFEHRRVNCRYCWGKNHRYQRTQLEQSQIIDKFKAALLKDPKGSDIDFEGGDGFQSNRDPNPECPECRGEGVGELIVMDTRRMSKGARSLISSIKQNKDGSIEVKLNSKDRASEMLARHLGLFNDKLEINGEVSHVVVVDV